MDLEPLFPKRKLRFVLCENVKNIDELIERSQSRENDDNDAAFPYALVDARIVVDPLQLITATTCALEHEKSGKLKSKRLHSEIVFCMSPSGNVNESLRRCGISPETTALVVAAVDPNVNAYNALLDDIQGTKNAVTKDTLSKHIKYENINKVYKLDKRSEIFRNKDPLSWPSSGSSECNLAGMLVSMIATQDT
eukprot:CFRG0401T1